MGTNYQKKFEKDYQNLYKKNVVVITEKKALKKQNTLLKKEVKYLKFTIQDIVDVAIGKAVAPLLAEINVIKKENTKLKKEVSRLKNQINKDSSNSGKPPSSNGFKKVIQNNRVKSNKSVGGQKGHKGTYLKPVKNPNKIVVYKKDKCDCGGAINHEKYSAKQEFNIKVITEVIEHRYHDGVCTVCGKVHNQQIPKELNNPANYGTSIKRFITFLNNQGLVSIDRSSEFLKLITNNLIKVSKGTVCNWNNELSNKLKPVIKYIEENLLNSEILHVDETPIKVNGKKMYIHNASTNKYTLQAVHKRRSAKAVEDIGFLKRYCGIIVSDHYLLYYKYGQDNAECNVHISRYLKNISEITKHTWDKNFLDFLYKIKELKEKKINAKYIKFNNEELSNIYKEYDDILKLGVREYEEAHHKEEDERKLLARLKKYKENHLMFIKNFKVPFSNNQSERDLRGAKTKQKIGKFRSLDGAKTYAIIRSIQLTCQKNSINFLEAISNAFNNKPVIPGLVTKK